MIDRLQLAEANGDSAKSLFKSLDHRPKDKKLSAGEWTTLFGDSAKSFEMFDAGDTDDDGVMSRKEFISGTNEKMWTRVAKGEKPERPVPTTATNSRIAYSGY